MASCVSCTGPAVDVTEIELQDLRPESSEENAPNPSSNPVHPSGSSSSTSSTTESSETAQSNTDGPRRDFMQWLVCRLRTLKIFTKNKLPETWLGKLTVFLGLYTAVFMTYETIALKRPTLDIGRSQASIAEAATATAEWTAYTTWKNSICPAEFARNISSSQCEAAMKEATPPPPKPRYPEEHSLSHRLARRLGPFVNALALLEKELDASDNHCRIGLVPDSPNTKHVCESIETPVVFHKRYTDSGTRSYVSEFSFPPTPTPQELNSWYMNVPHMLFLFILWLGTSVAGSLLFWTWIKVCESSQLRLLREWPIHESWYWYCLRSPLWLILLLLGIISDLAKTVAVYQFLDNCIAQKTSQVELCDACVRLFKRSSTLPMEIEIRLWSLWQGYLFTRVRFLSIDNFVFVSIILVNASVVLYGHRGQRYIEQAADKKLCRPYLPTARVDRLSQFLHRIIQLNNQRTRLNTQTIKTQDFFKEH